MERVSDPSDLLQRAVCIFGAEDGCPDEFWIPAWDSTDPKKNYDEPYDGSFKCFIQEPDDDDDDAGKGDSDKKRRKSQLTGSGSGKCLKKITTAKEDDNGVVDETGLVSDDIKLLIDRASVPRSKAARALRDANGDIAAAFNSLQNPFDV